MLSDRFYKILGIQQVYASYILGAPFRWHPDKREFRYCQRRYFSFALGMFSLALYVLFLAIQLLRYQLMGKTTDFYYYFLYALVVCGIFDLIASYPFLAKPHLAAAFLTELFSYLHTIEEYMPTFDPKTSCVNYVFDGLIAIMTVGYPICGLIISCHFLVFPHWPCYLSSLYPPDELPLSVYLFSGGIYFYGLQWIWAILLLSSMALLTYGRYMWLVVIEFFCFPPNVRGPQAPIARKIWSQQKASPSFRTFENIPMKYRQLEILHWNFMETFSSIIIPIQMTLTSLGIFCNFSLIKHRQELNITNTCILLIWSIGGTIATLIGLTFCGEMYLLSVRMLKTIKFRDWGSKRKSMYMIKFAASCKPISYGYGRMYTIRKLSSFKYIKHLTRGTFRALLTNKGRGR